MTSPDKLPPKESPTAREVSPSPPPVAAAPPAATSSNGGGQNSLAASNVIDQKSTAKILPLTKTMQPPPPLGDSYDEHPKTHRKLSKVGVQLQSPEPLKSVYDAYVCNVCIAWQKCHVAITGTL